MLLFPFELLELAFECFESRSNGWNWHLNALNPFRMVVISIRTLRIQFKRLQLEFECFYSHLNYWNWLSNALNPVRMVGIGI